MCAILMCCRVRERDRIENSINVLSHRMKDYFESGPILTTRTQNVLNYS